jgi:Na+-driven multidrug efflux pump
MKKLTVKDQVNLSLPMAFDALVNTLMTVVDTFVAVSLGYGAIAAIGAVGIVLNFTLVAINAINTANRTTVANLRGKNDTKTVGSTTGNSVLLGLALSAIFVAIIVGISPTIPELFNIDKAAGLSYLYVRLFGLLQLSTLTILCSHERAMGNPKRILVLRSVCLVLNLALDILIINLGFGLAGLAAITVLIDTILMVYLIVISKHIISYKYNRERFLVIFNLTKWNMVERIISRIDQFILNLVVARISTLQFAVHVILTKIFDIFEDFATGFQGGVEITAGMAIGSKSKQNIKQVKLVVQKIINSVVVIAPLLLGVVAIIIMHFSLQDIESLRIFYIVLPVMLAMFIIKIKSLYCFAIIRAAREFAFLARRNFIVSVIKVAVALALFIPLQILGVWLAMLAYMVSMWVLSYWKYRKMPETSIQQKNTMKPKNPKIW